jgi:hypothetical protein
MRGRDKLWTNEEVRILCENSYLGMKELRKLLPDRTDGSIKNKSSVLGGQIKRGLYKERTTRYETREERRLRILTVQNGHYWKNEEELERSFNPTYFAEELKGEELKMLKKMLCK